MEDTTSPQPTPEASFDGIATKKSISDFAKKVNSSDEKNSTRFAVQRRFRTKMTKNADFQRAYKWLLRILNGINREISLPMQDRVLATMLLDSEEKILKFIEWLQTKTNSQGELQTTAQDVMIQVNLISMGKA